MLNDKIDEQIRQALSTEEAKLFDTLEEQSLFDQALQLLRGRNRLINGIVILLNLVFLGFSGFCLWKFYLAEELKPMLGWCLAFGFSILAMSMIKLWSWMEIEKNCTIREIKRLELQVAQLGKKLAEKDA